MYVFVSVMLSLIIAALWLSAGKGLTNLLALLYLKFSCVFVTFPSGFLGHVLYLIVSIPDICLLLYFNTFL